MIGYASALSWKVRYYHGLLSNFGKRSSCVVDGPSLHHKYAAEGNVRVRAIYTCLGA